MLVLDISIVFICNILIDKFKIGVYKNCILRINKKIYNSKIIKTFLIIEVENNVLVWILSREKDNVLFVVLFNFFFGYLFNF